MKSQTTLLSDPAAAGFRLEHSPFYWLTRASGRYLLTMERRLKRIGMDVPRWRVLMILAETEPASISTLSEHAVIKLSTMTRIVGRMAEAGLVTTRASADDGRVTEARMTDEGRAALERVRREGSAVFRSVFGEAPDAEIVQLIGQLQRITGALAAAKSDHGR